jgi:hypothetical protein
MKVTLLRNSALGRMGQVRSMDASSARGAILLGLAEKYVEPPPPPRPKRVYKRKDIVPEPDFVAEDPQPLPEPEPEAEDDDAPVRSGD